MADLQQYSVQLQQLLADPRVQAQIAEQRKSGRGGSVSPIIEPREFGITSLPPNIKLDARSGQLIDNSVHGSAWGPLIGGGALLGLGAAGLAGVGPLAGSAASGAAPAATGGITSGMITNTAPSLGLATAPPGGSALGFLGKHGSDLLGAAGVGIGRISQTQAANRGEEFGGQGLLAALQGQADRDYSNQSIAREQEGRTGREDAWRKLLSSQHTLSPGDRPQLAGQYNIAPRQATGAERTGAEALSSEVMARLQGGNPLPVVKRRNPLESIDPNLLKAGKVENTLGYLSPILRYLGG